MRCPSRTTGLVDSCLRSVFTLGAERSPERFTFCGKNRRSPISWCRETSVSFQLLSSVGDLRGKVWLGKEKLCSRRGACRLMLERQRKESFASAQKKLKEFMDVQNCPTFPHRPIGARARQHGGFGLFFGVGLPRLVRIGSGRHPGRGLGSEDGGSIAWPPIHSYGSHLAPICGIIAIRNLRVIWLYWFHNSNIHHTISPRQNEPTEHNL